MEEIVEKYNTFTFLKKIIFQNKLFYLLII